MVYFIAGAVAAWAVEWVLYTFWWKRKSTAVAQSTASGESVTSLTQALDQANQERRRLEAALQASNEEAASLRARIAAASAAPAETSTTKAGVSKAGGSGGDLKSISGLGPKTQELLSGAGFKSLEDLAAADPDTLRAVLASAGTRFAMIDSSSWPQQARLLIAGDAEALRRLQEGLKKS